MLLLILFTIISITSTTSIENDSDQVFQPQFDRLYETVSVVVGKRALLPCYVSLKDVKNNGMDTFKIIWMKLNNSSILTMEDRAINGDPRISLLHAYADEWNLQIDDIDEDDAGTYRCFVNNGKYKTVSLDVKVPPKIVDELTTVPYPPSVRVGSNFTIKCHAHGKPTPNIRILAYDQAENPRIISDKNEVTIYNISRHTERHYECIASNGYPPDVARSIQLTVQYPPEISLFINDEIVTNMLFINSNANDIRLKCRAIMNPFEKVFWLKDNQKVEWNYQIYHLDKYIILEMIIDDLRGDYPGEYSCVASNLLGRTSQTVQIISLSPTTTTMKMERITSRHKRPKPIRTTTDTSLDFYSTESLRAMTLSSNDSQHTSPLMVIVWICLLFIFISKS
ncbi:unnamed protein product [Adineta ricciae]|uniref:Ig-like domain-containing protein n=1 Tax=Adineta ricciae TaxID=249248 RepID=A0A813Q495_ADIRI|nr:unnamed protein product [Adineta ricciae]